MKLEIRKIDIKSVVLSALPLTVFFLAVLGGIITFFVIDNPQYAMMSALSKAISVAVYAIIYTIMATALAVFSVFLYNFFGAVLGLRGLTIDLDEYSEATESEEESQEEEAEAEEQQ